MAKVNDRPLMRQKINVSPALLKKWNAEYLFDIRQMIHGSLMKPEDIGATFNHQDRTFEIVGMGEGRTLMLRETREEGVFYWECARQFVQMKLGRFNKAFQKTPLGKTVLVDIPYEDTQLHLAPKNKKRGKPAPVKDEEETFEDDYSQEISIEEYDGDVIDETSDFDN